MLGGIYKPSPRKVPMAGDAVRPASNPFDLLRIDFVRGDGVAICSAITPEGDLRFVAMPDGRRFAMRGTSHWPIKSLTISHSTPFVPYPKCEFCGAPADRMEPFDGDVPVCEQCSA